MTIRVVFQCSRCGSNSFRPSSLRTFKDTVLKHIGVAPQRCLMCRRRFYLYRPASLQWFLRILAGSSEQEKEGAVPLHSKIPVARTGKKIAFSRLAEDDSEAPRENLAG